MEMCTDSLFLKPDFFVCLKYANEVDRNPATEHTFLYTHTQNFDAFTHEPQFSTTVPQMSDLVLH